MNSLRLNVENQNCNYCLVLSRLAKKLDLEGPGKVVAALVVLTLLGPAETKYGGESVEKSPTRRRYQSLQGGQGL